jgi:hypothetical protein
MLQLLNHLMRWDLLQKYCRKEIDKLVAAVASFTIYFGSKSYLMAQALSY